MLATFQIPTGHGRENKPPISSGEYEFRTAVWTFSPNLIEKLGTWTAGRRGKQTGRVAG